MPFYLRKSFRMGPLRLNLSKSGLGLSGGVTGARIGINARGQSYVHGGRYGLYYRKNLGAIGGHRAGHNPYPQREDHFVDTGLTFAASTAAAPTDPSPPWPQLPNLLGGSNWWNPLAILRRRKARESLAGALREACSPKAAVTTRGLAARHRAEELVATALPLEDARAIGLSLYRELAVEAVADQVLSGSEHKALDWVARVAKIDRHWRERANADALRVAFLAMIADHELSSEEQHRFDKLRRAFVVDDADLRNELETAERLQELRKLREGVIPVIDTAHKLQRGELCHLAAPGRVLTSKILGRRRHAGVEHVFHGLVLRHEARCWSRTNA